MLYDFIEIEGEETQKCEAGKYTHQQIKEYVAKQGKKLVKIETRALVEDEPKDQEYYYTVRLNYSDTTRDVTITKEQLPHALWAFIKKTDVVFDGGGFRGRDIISILPDYVATMGWNKGYTPTSEEMGMIAKSETCNEARRLCGEVKLFCNESSSLPELLKKTNQLLLN